MINEMSLATDLLLVNRIVDARGQHKLFDWMPTHAPPIDAFNINILIGCTPRIKDTVNAQIQSPLPRPPFEI